MKKEKILKATKVKRQITFKRMPVRVTGDFSSAPLEVRKNGMLFSIDEIDK